MSILEQAALFLGAAVIFVPIFKRCGLGAVLGYLAAGIAIGPWGLGVIYDVENILHFAELGVVLLLFVIGLELQPSRLWKLRKSVFGLGGAQLLLTGLVLAVVAWVLGLPPAAAVVAGLGLALSSTAFALQTLAEKNELTTRHGRAAFATLLFQDLAVIPMLALIPLLSPDDQGASSLSWLAVAQVIGVLAAVIVVGHFGLGHVFRLVATARNQEVFTAMTLVTVIGTALLMEYVGLSMALGSFLAGVLLADSDYRHTLEADIEPFKGLLLGLFFIAVGMTVDLGLIVSQPVLIVVLVIALVSVKGLLLFVCGRFYGLNNASARKLAFAISQGGEFAFVIFGVAVGAEVMDKNVSDLLIVAVTLSMAVTPLLFILNERLLEPWLQGPPKDEYEMPDGEEHQVIIAGFGRVGQIVARMLRAKKIGFTALEINPEQVDFVRKYGNRIFYGDASRLDLLRAAKADRAVVLVLAVDDVSASLRIAETVIKHFPHLKIYARARNRKHAYQLMDLGITQIRRETFLSSIQLAGEVLQGLGLSQYQSERAMRTFRKYDERRLFAHYSHHNDEQKMQQLAKKALQELEELFEQDAQEMEGSGQ